MAAKGNNIPSGLSQEEMPLPGLGLEANNQPGFQPLRFDPAEFMKYVQDEDLTEEEATALLRAIWDVVVGFVDLAFGLGPIKQTPVDRIEVPANHEGSQESPVIKSRQNSTSFDRNTSAPSKSRGR